MREPIWFQLRPESGGIAINLRLVTRVGPTNGGQCVVVDGAEMPIGTDDATELKALFALAQKFAGTR